MFRLAALSLAAAAVFALPGRSTAGPIVLFNTGVDAGGTVLPDGTVGDPHYTLTSAPGGSTTALRVRTSAGGYPIPPWVGDNALSAWVGPNNAADVSGPNGVYVYRTTFDLTGFDPTTASITGQWSTDDQGLDIRINGVSTGQTTPSEDYENFHAFAVNGGFVAGLNTLDFVVENQFGGPTGVRVEMTGTAANAVPAPPALALAGLGALGSAGFARLRRRKAATA